MSTVEGLRHALASSSIHRIILTPAKYLLSSQLEITRAVEVVAGELGAVTLDAQGSGRVMYINAPGADMVKLTGLRITGGHIYDRLGGAGVAIANGSVAFVSSSIYNNAVDAFGGGGVSIWNAYVSFDSTTIYQNAAAFGGGVDMRYGIAHFISASIESNTAHDSGGGVFVSEGTVSFSSTSVVFNSAQSAGGGMSLLRSLGSFKIYSIFGPTHELNPCLGTTTISA